MWIDDIFHGFMWCLLYRCYIGLECWIRTQGHISVLYKENGGKYHGECMSINLSFSRFLFYVCGGGRG